MSGRATAVRAVRGRAQAAAERLRSLSLAEAADAVGRAAGEAAAELRGVPAAEPDPGGIRAHLVHALDAWRTGALAALARAGLADAIAGPSPWPVAGGFLRGPRRLVVVSGAGAPGAGLDFAVTGLLLRAPVLWRPARGDAAFPRRFQRALAAAHPVVGEALGIVPFPRSDEAAWRALLGGADAVVALGPDAACRAVGRRVSAAGRFIPFPSRASIAVAGRAALAAADIGLLAAAIARDVLLLDQAGCLSIQLVLCEGETTHLADALASALDAGVASIPPLPRTSGHRARIQATRDTARMKGWRVLTPADGGTAWTVVEARASREDARRRLPASPLGRTVIVVPVRDLDADLLRLLAPLRGRLQGVAFAGPDDARRDLARRIAASTGVARVTAPGLLQAPPAGWSEDERPWPFPLLFRTDVE